MIGGAQISEVCSTCAPPKKESLIFRPIFFVFLCVCGVWKTKYPKVTVIDLSNG